MFQALRRDARLWHAAAQPSRGQPGGQTSLVGMKSTLLMTGRCEHPVLGIICHTSHSAEHTLCALSSGKVANVLLRIKSCCRVGPQRRQRLI